MSIPNEGDIRLEFNTEVQRAYERGDDRALFQLADLLAEVDDMPEAYRVRNMGLRVVTNRIKDEHF